MQQRYNSNTLNSTNAINSNLYFIVVFYFYHFIRRLSKFFCIGYYRSNIAMNIKLFQ